MNTNKIPIKNIYYILCYAWDCLEELDIVDRFEIEGENTADLLTYVLIREVEQLLMHGIIKQYQDREVEIPKIKGRLCVSETVARCLLPQGKTVCEVDRLTPNILPNQIIKTTLYKIHRASDVDSILRNRARLLLREMPEISFVDLKANLFQMVSRSRHRNRKYGFLMNICALICANTFVSEESGLTEFKDFIRDERNMNRLYEKFLFNFFQYHLPEDFKVESRNRKWDGYALDKISEDLLPIMRTDIEIVNRATMDRMIIDAKFYKKTLVHGLSDKLQVRSNHLYQLLAYLKNSDVREPYSIRGMLLYPETQIIPSLDYEIWGYPVQIQTINLNQDWVAIKRDLLSLIQSNVFRYSKSA